MPKISIIMPLYNAERFLKETLASIKKQKLQEYELICINDGSEDHTAHIVEEHAKKDSRYVVLNNPKREGAAFSRNRGIKVARGEYLCFLDGDDIFDENMLEEAYQKCIQEKLDIVIFNCMHVQSEKIYEKKLAEREQKYKEKYCKNPFQIKSLKPHEIVSFSDRVCDRLIRRKFIVESGIEFQNLPSNNDALFGTLSLYLAQKVLFLDDNRVMVYARDHDTFSRISHYRDPMCIYYALLELENELIKRKIWEKYSEYYFYYCLQQINCVFPTTVGREEKFVEFMINQGIPKLIQKGNSEYRKQDKLTRFLFDTMLSEKKKIQLPNHLLCTKFPENQDYFFKYKLCGKKIALWGAGNNGRAILNIFSANDLFFDYLIDSNKDKRGELVGYLKVSTPEEVEKKVDVIITTNEAIYIDIKNIYEQKGIAVKNYFE